jgi:hypothetical protein
MPIPEHERRALSFSDEQLDHIAEAAAEKAAVRAVEMIKANLYQEAGKAVVAKLLQLIGIAAIGILYWLNKTGFFERI